ncbi:annexin-B12-like [Ruditapes philippinarum]|uniref:annexin-B12-like n=1 Tax=Ruditapes philippinarum TaxID=129788 RepID=UPI00295BF0F7|nr:annexin-B12-like [Ruditapes philippinarum]
MVSHVLCLGNIDLKCSASAADDYDQNGTLRQAAKFNAENDAIILSEAMKGLNIDEKAIIDILANRTNNQRQDIEQKFKTCFGKALTEELKCKLGGKFKDVMIDLMWTPEEFDSYELKNAMTGICTDRDAMIEILCSRNNAQIQKINEAYLRMYKWRLEQDIINETSGHFKELMVSLANGERMENQAVDMNKANSDAQFLVQAEISKMGTEKSRMIEIMALQSYEQLRALFNEYTSISGRSIEMSEILDVEMLPVIECVRHRPGYFAKKIYKSMKDASTDHRTLIRIMVTRAEVDMEQIKQVFQKMYGQSLEQFVRDAVSSEYSRVILGMIGAGY